MAGILSRVPGEAIIVLGMCAAASGFGAYTLANKLSNDKDLYYMPNERKKVRDSLLSSFNGTPVTSYTIVSRLS